MQLLVNIKSTREQSLISGACGLANQGAWRKKWKSFIEVVQHMFQETTSRICVGGLKEALNYCQLLHLNIMVLSLCTEEMFI